jgi:hypothetical protein
MPANRVSEQSYFLLCHGGVPHQLSIQLYRINTTVSILGTNRRQCLSSRCRCLQKSSSPWKVPAQPWRCLLKHQWMCLAGAALCTKVRSIASSWPRRCVPGHAGVLAAAGVRSRAQVAFARQAGAVGGKESLSTWRGRIPSEAAYPTLASDFPGMKSC